MNYMPRVQIAVPPDRDYVMTLTQTKLVYDQLLGDKYNKLTESILRKKDMFDKECMNLEKSKGADHAMEYGVKAQAQINQMSQESERELIELQQDYQSKLNKMHAQLEESWRKQHGH